jgi:serine/threonine-protein kinase RsbT
MQATIALNVHSRSDVLHARREARAMAISDSFSAQDVDTIGLAVAELGTNLLRHARDGVLTLVRREDERGNGIEVRSVDNGPGIEDVNLAMQDGYSTKGGLGSGLPATRRLMDDFAITSSPTGTQVRACKWISHGF